MARHAFYGFLFATAQLCAATSAWATCSTTASPAALDDFTSNPQAWIDAHKGDSNVGDQMKALAAAAANAKSASFGKAFGAALGHASADVGKAVGTAMKGLVGNCTDPNDPGDAKDKAYISENIVSQLTSNVAANEAYGADDTQTAATGGGGGAGGGGLGGGGGGGTGTGSVGGGLPAGGSNTGAAVGDASTSSPTAGFATPGASSGSIGVP